MLMDALTVFNIFDFQKGCQTHGVQFLHRHRSMANVIAKIALCGLDILFGGKHLNILYHWNGKSERKNVRETFVAFDICHGMGVIANIALRHLDVPFGSKNKNKLYLQNGKS